VRIVANYPLFIPFWFENTRGSWHNATQKSVKRLFQAIGASFQSLGLVFAFSSNKRFFLAHALLQKRS
jgi:hypothetical protein